MRFVLLALCASLPFPSFGNGMRLPSQDAFATGRGEAFTATADNPSAIYYNPAGLTQLSGVEVRAGLYGLYMDPHFTPPTPRNTNAFEIENKTVAAPQFFASFTPSDKPVSFGLGVFAPFGAAIEWPQDTGFRTVATAGELTCITFNPALAVQFLPELSVGVGVAATYGDILLEQGLLRTETPFENIFRFEGDGWGVGANCGVLWKPSPKLSFGASFRTPTRILMEGQTEVEQQPIIQRTFVDAEAEFEFPLIIMAGVSYRPSPAWNFEFNADYTYWDCFDTVMLKQKERPPFPIRQDIPISLMWEESWIYKFGVTRYFENAWHVSAGYAFNQNSVPDTYYTPLAADLDRHILSAGIGRKGKRVDFDLAYQFGYGPTREVTGSMPSSSPGFFAGQNADGSYDFRSHAVFISVGTRF